LSGVIATLHSFLPLIPDLFLAGEQVRLEGAIGAHSRRGERGHRHRALHETAA